MRPIHDVLKRIFAALGYTVVKSGKQPILPTMRDGSPVPDAEFYRPLFSPWEGGGFGDAAPFLRAASQLTVVSPDRLWTLCALLQQAGRVAGDVWECGVYRGGTAKMFAEVIASSTWGQGKALRLFDTFAGMPATSPSVDWHNKGDFIDTTLAGVQAAIGPMPFVHYHPGLIPTTFSGREADRIAFAHVDVDIYSSVLDCCHFILPRLAIGGILVFDDYGFPTCPGARKAVDEAFLGTPYAPLVLPTGQAVVFKNV